MISQRLRVFGIGLESYRGDLFVIFLFVQVNYFTVFSSKCYVWDSGNSEFINDHRSYTLKLSSRET